MTKYLGPKVDAASLATKADIDALSSASGAAIEVSSTPPNSPSTGDLWFDSDVAKLYIYYDSSWVNPASIGAGINTGSAQTITGNNAEGTSNNLARADHNHQIQAVGAFSAYLSADSSSFSSATIPVVEFNVEDLDVSGWFDHTTNKGRYTPQLAGYYLIGGYFRGSQLSGNGKYWLIEIYKNGAAHRQVGLMLHEGFLSLPRMPFSTVVEANGTTDYFDLRAQHTSTTNETIGGGAANNASRIWGHYLGSA